MSNIYTLEMDLELKEKLNINTICKQFDTVHLNFSIFDNSAQADLANYNIRLKAMKYDNIPLIQETNYTIVNNVVIIIADEQLTTTSGKTLVELQFIDKTTRERKSTFNLVLNVVASTLEVNRTISTSTYTLLQELENKLDQAGDFLQNVKEAIDASNTLKTGIATATTLKSDLDNSISTGNTTKTNLETSITNANSSKTNLDTRNTEATVNISTLTTKNNEASSNITKLTELNQNTTTLEQNLQSLDSENNKASSNIPNLTTQNVNATQNISDLTAKNTTAEANKTNLDSANTQAQANIQALNKLGDVTGIAQDVTSLKSEVITARGTEANLGARLDKFNTSLSENTKQIEIANLATDLNTCGVNGKRVFHKTNETTLNTPYKFGMTGDAVQGCVETYITNNFGIQIYIAIGNRVKNDIYNRWKTIYIIKR